MLMPLIVTVGPREVKLGTAQDRRGNPINCDSDGTSRSLARSLARSLSLSLFLTRSPFHWVSETVREGLHLPLQAVMGGREREREGGVINIEINCFQK